MRFGTPDLHAEGHARRSVQIFSTSNPIERRFSLLAISPDVASKCRRLLEIETSSVKQLAKSGTHGLVGAVFRANLRHEPRAC